jgi:hypothetical protein
VAARILGIRRVLQQVAVAQAVIPQQVLTGLRQLQIRAAAAAVLELLDQETLGLAVLVVKV